MRPTPDKKKPRDLKWQFIDDLDRSGLPSAQRDVVRRIASHARPDGTGSHPSIRQLGEELGGKSDRSIQDALNGRADRGWQAMIGTWVERVSVGRRGRASEYRLLDENERREAARQLFQQAATSTSQRPNQHQEPASRHQRESQAVPRVPHCDPDIAVTPSCDPSPVDPFDRKVDLIVAGLLLDEDPTEDPWYSVDPEFTAAVDEAVRRYKAMPTA